MTTLLLNIAMTLFVTALCVMIGTLMRGLNNAGMPRPIVLSVGTLLIASLVILIIALWSH